MKVALLDMYEGVENEGMRCIRELLIQFAETEQIPLQLNEFEVRRQRQVPDLSYDVYISSGGPGSPVDSAGSAWEQAYFRWLDGVLEWNAGPNPRKKYVFLICHSFQVVCRYYELGQVCRRKSAAFGVFPVHKTAGGLEEPLFGGLPDPFHIVDSRNWQVVQPNEARLAAMGASILAIEKERPHVPLERATMAIRFNPYMIGTQFHPEADAPGMRKHLLLPAKKQRVVAEHGAEKYDSMLELLREPDKIPLTHDTLLPNFLHDALLHQREYQYT
ncbi:GMP synthase [Chitinophaga lutea]|uniref:GMP synthase n=1 Tax=Chitinophaga lutea TaxID=2488634 RepID=A0A3N4PDU1_9BACT|nr:GMP synthase [Chitinophaga lutea]RPE05598.1 GMP synthase [Chitinophaga lutea]